MTGDSSLLCRVPAPRIACYSPLRVPVIAGIPAPGPGACRMTLPGRQERLLQRADRALCRSDPHLASMLSIFARLTAAERMPAREQLRPPPARARLPQPAR